MGSTPLESARVLRVGDDAGSDDDASNGDQWGLADTAVTVVDASTMDGALAELSSGGLDCVVAAQDLPDGTGIELLQAVRARDGDLPFFLCPLDGDEGLASTATANGVTEYVPRSAGLDTGAVLRDRLEAALESPRGEPRRVRTEQRRDRFLDRVPTAVIESRDAGERSLERGKRRYRNLVEDAPVPINLFDETGETVWGNDAVLDLLGLDTREELIGRSIFEFVHPDDEAVAEGELADIFDAETSIGPTRFRLKRADGDVRHVQIHTSAGWFDGEPVGQAMVVDLTELREKDAEVRRSENRYRTLVEMSPYSILVHSDGEIRYANDAFARQVGVSDPDAVVGTSILDYLPASKHDEVVEDARQTQRGEQLPTNREYEMVTVDGRTRYITTTSRPVMYEDDTAVLTVLNDRTQARHYQQAVKALHENTRDMFRADDVASIAAIAVETAHDLIDVASGVVYEFQEARNVLTPITDPESDGVDAGPGAVVAPGDDQPVWETFVSGTRRHVPDETTESGASTGVDVGCGVYLPLGDHGVFAVDTGSGGDASDTEIELCSILAANLEAALDSVAQERALREREARLESQATVLEDVERLNGIIRDIVRSIYEVTTREGVRNAVCGRLGERDQYAAVWIGEWVTDSEGVTPLSTAGAQGGLLDELVAQDAGSPLQSVVEQALAANEVTVVNQILGDRAWESMREPALQYGFQSIAAVPIPIESDVDEVLVVHGTKPGAFTGEQREVFAELGRMVGSALELMDATNPQLAGARTALDLEIDGERLLCNRLAERLEAGVTVRGSMPTGTGTHILFVHTEADVDAVLDVGAALHAVESMDVVASDESAALFQCEVTESPFFEVLAEYDAAVQSMRTAASGRTAVTVQLPSRASVREFVEALRDVVAGVRLVARRSNVSTVETPMTVRETVRERCTDRQFQALQAAFYGGYYEWPRLATNEDLGNALSISSPTYQSHRRAAERIVMATLFDEWQ